MAEAGLQEVDTYVSCRQNMTAQYIETRPIMDLCLAADRILGTRVSNQWGGSVGSGLGGDVDDGLGGGTGGERKGGRRGGDGDIFLGGKIL